MRPGNCLRQDLGFEWAKPTEKRYVQVCQSIPFPNPLRVTRHLLRTSPIGENLAKNDPRLPLINGAFRVN
jgi:hypothetical protein